MSMEISVRDSISLISEIQEQLQTDTLDSKNTEVCENKLLLCAVVVCLLTYLFMDQRLTIYLFFFLRWKERLLKMCFHLYEQLAISYTKDEKYR